MEQLYYMEGKLMIRVLVAEDEIPLLRGIKIMIERLNPEFSVVKTAYNGQEAIEYLKEHPVDVVFTDINMPMIDGLGLLKYVSEHYPDVIQIVISGYNDFSYAQQAISYKVKRYLLKPIVKDELEKLLEEIEEYHRKIQIRKQREHLVDVIYTGKKDRTGESVQILTLCAGPFIESGMEESVVECDFWKNMDVEQCATRFMPDNSFVYSFEKNQANERILLICTQEEIALEELAEYLVNEMEKENIHVTIAYHKTAIETLEIPRVSRRLRKQVKENALMFRSNIVQDTKEQRKNESQLRSEEWYQQCVQYLEIEQLKEKIPKEHILQTECEQLLSAFLKHKMGEKQDEREVVENLLLYSANFEQLLINLEEIVRDREVDNKNITKEEIMEQVEKYIQEHIKEPITCQELAKEFGLVAPYLSKLFKEHIGYTPSQYIQKMRLEQAKFLLSTNDKILAKDVAEMVGYPNPLYFSKIFKKKVGIYPSEYRDREKITG